MLFTFLISVSAYSDTEAIEKVGFVTGSMEEYENDWRNSNSSDYIAKHHPDMSALEVWNILHGFTPIPPRRLWRRLLRKMPKPNETLYQFTDDANK